MKAIICTFQRDPVPSWGGECLLSEGGMRVEAKKVKKSAVEKYNYMDETSSKENWNHDFGTIILDVFERAVRKGEVNKTVKELINEIEIEFNPNGEI